ncbi:MAG: penicillin-binding transpeptidase domain-containing protein, partial [Patescibacteria group bacterium]
MELNAIQKQPLIKNDRFSSQERVWRGVFFISLAVASLIFLISRLFVLQIVKGSYYETVSDENRIRAEVLKAYRGVIKDREGRILAQNSPSFNIKINKNVSNYSEIIKKLSIFIDTSSPVSVGEFTIFGNVNRDTAIKIEAGFFGSFAVAVETAPQRDYLYPEELAHLLGYVSFISSEADDRVGVIGVEKFYDIYLRGSHGSLLYEYDAKGSILREIARKEPVNGKDLTISIDLDLQLKSYEALKKAVEETGATGGVVVAQNPKNGEILALVSLPSFNPNLFSRGISSADYNKIVSDPLHPMFNRALLGQYPPGSVFKIVTASAVLEEGVVT